MSAFYDMKLQFIVNLKWFNFGNDTQKILVFLSLKCKYVMLAMNKMCVFFVFNLKMLFMLIMAS